MNGGLGNKRGSGESGNAEFTKGRHTDIRGVPFLINGKRGRTYLLLKCRLKINTNGGRKSNT